MAATTITVDRNVGYGAGTTVTTYAVDASNGNNFANTGREVVQISNGSGGDLTVTLLFDAGNRFVWPDGTARTKTYTVSNGNLLRLGPFGQSVFKTTLGFVEFSFSTGSSVRIGIYGWVDTPES